MKPDMRIKSEVFNNTIGSPYAFHLPNLTKEQSNEILAGLFEQLLVFDRIVISTNRLNFALVFLINRLGINTVERLIDYEYIKLMIWSPVVVTSNGKKLSDGTIDESVIYGQPPLAAGSLTKDDSDPERNIKAALSHFNLHSDRKKIFLKKALKNYIVPNGMEFSSNSADFIIDAYKRNNLAGLGLPFNQEPEQLNVEQRQLLLSLSHKVIETSLLSKYNLKSYDNYEHFEICKQNLSNIGKAYNVSENTSVILHIENIPKLKTLYLTERMDFESVFKIRHYSNAKYFRKWINEIGENSNAQEITKEYLNEIKGNNNFFDSTGGKLIRNLGMFGVSTALGNYIAGTQGTVAGGALGLLDAFWLESILKGKNPSMFIEDIRRETETVQATDI